MEKNDVRSTNLTENFIQSAFQWVGNSSNNNPLSKIPNDTFLTKIIPINTNQCIIVPENDKIKNLINTIDYFIGIELWIEETNQTSTVIFYDKRLFLITLDEDIFNVIFEEFIIVRLFENSNMENFLSMDAINTVIMKKKFNLY